MVHNRRVVLIGAGNVATHLGSALQNTEWKVVQVYSRTEAAASELGRLLGVEYVTSLDEVYTDADIYLVMVKDAVLQELIPAVVRGKEGALFVHTAGSMSMDVWKGWASSYGVLYPMQTFSKARKVDFSSVSFFVEANSGTELKILKELACSLSDKVYEATSLQRAYLHLAAVFACNFANHMYAVSELLLKSKGLPFDAMLPLIDETARKVHELLPGEGQTGPAVRRDTNVMNKHLDMLSETPELKNLYKMISESIQKL